MRGGHALAVLCFPALVGMAAAQQPGEDATPALSDLLVKRSELPPGFHLTSGTPSAARSATLIFDTAQEKEKFWSVSAVAKARQTLVAGTSPTGVLFYFEFGDHTQALSAERNPWGMCLLLYGPSGARDEDHPAEILVWRRFVILIAYPLGAPAAEWAKARLRKKFHIPAPRYSKQRAALALGALAAADDGRPEEGLKFLEEDDRLRNWSYGWYLMGQLSMLAENYQDARAAYAHALNLSDSLADPLDDHAKLSALLGLGRALLMEKVPKVAVPVFQRAYTFARREELDVEGSYRALRCAQSATSDCQPR